MFIFYYLHTWNNERITWIPFLKKEVLVLSDYLAVEYGFNMYKPMLHS